MRPECTECRPASITREPNHAFNRQPVYRIGAMLILAAISRFTPVRETPSSELLATSAIGHVGLTIIALVYVLVTLWQRG